MDKLEQLSRNISERISQENDYEWEMGEIHCTALNLMQENKDLSTSARTRARSDAGIANRSDHRLLGRYEFRYALPPLVAIR